MNLIRRAQLQIMIPLVICSIGFGQQKTAKKLEQSPTTSVKTRPANSISFEALIFSKFPDGTTGDSIEPSAGSESADAPLDVAQPSVRVTSPNGGELWNEDMIHRITWNASYNLGITRIQVLLSLDNGKSYVAIRDSVSNSTSSINWQIPRSPTTNGIVKIVVFGTDGKVGIDSSDAVFAIVGVQSFIHKTSRISTTIRNDSHFGSIGGSAAGSQPGVEFPPGSGNNHLFLGQLLIGAIKGGTDTVVTMEYSDEFIPIDVIRVVNKPNYVQTITRYRDKSGFGIEVAERTYAFPDEAYVIHDFRVFNSSNTALPSIYLGLYGDFDVGDGRVNRVGISTAEGLIYMFSPSSATSASVGMAMLERKPLAVRRWAGNVAVPGTTGEMFRRMAIAGEDAVLGDSPSDYRVMQSFGPLSVPVGGSTSIAFVVAAGSGLTDLVTSVRLAKTRWLEVSGLVAELEPNNNAAQAQLVAYGDSLSAEIRPVGDLDFFKYSVVVGDTVDVISQNVGDSELDGHLIAFDHAGAPIISNDDFLSWKDSRVTYVAKVTGTNYLRFADLTSVSATTGVSAPRPESGRRLLDLNSASSADDVRAQRSSLNTGQYKLFFRRFRKGSPVGTGHGSFNHFSTSASVAGKFYPNGLSTTITMNYGTTPAYGNTLTISGSPFNTIEEVDFSADLSGLTPNTEYHYQFVGTNALGTFKTPNQTLKTPESSRDWTKRNSGTMEFLWSLSFGAQRIGTAVGTSGIILRTLDGGASWNVQKSGIEQTLLGVAFADANSGVAVGVGGALLRTTNGGNTWENRSSTSGLVFADVTMIDASVAFAVGNGGVIVRTANGGITWPAQTSTTTAHLRGVHFSRTNTGIVVGNNGTILRTTNSGTIWTPIASPVAESFYKVYFPDPDTGYIVSVEGGIIKTVNGGLTWVKQQSGVTQWLADIFFSDGRNGIVVGEDGLVLRTTNGGSTWIKEISGTGNVLISVAPNRDGGLVAVGEYGTIMTGSVTAGPAVPSNAALSPPGWSKTNSFVLSWSNPPNSTIQKVWVKYNEPPSPTSPATSFFSISSPSITLTVPDVGSHQVYFYLEDKDGNRNPYNHAMVVARYDSVKPAVTHAPGSVAKVVFNNGSITGSPPSITATSSKASNLSGVVSTKLQYKRSNDNSFTDLEFPAPTGGTISIPGTIFVVSSSPRSADYRIRATDEAGNVTVTPTYSILVEVQSQSTATTLPPAAGEGNDRDALVKSYRLFSVPLDLTNKKPSEFMESTERGFGPHRKENINYYFWRMSRYTGGTTQHYEDFKNSDVLTVGSAFFLIRRDGSTTIKVGPGNLVKVKDMVDTGILLQAGWNLVGNPFPYSFSSDSLTVSSGSITARAYYDGTGPQSGWYTSGTQIRTLFPWQGLAVNVTQASTLKFKALPSEGLQSAPLTEQLSAAALRGELERSGGGWLLSISATRLDNGMRDVENLLGMVRGASEEFDLLDMYQPPFVGEKNVALYFMNGTGALSNDFRPLNPEGGVWEMKIESGDRGARVRVTWDASQLPRDPLSKAFLIDLDEKMAYDLRHSNAAEITTKSGQRNFRVVVGDAQYVRSHSAGVELVPQVAKLFANYPNPFNAETMIRYAIPGEMQSYQVALRVYNVIGQEVATLVEEEQRPGYYEVRFHSNELASGIYLYRLTVLGGTKESTFADARKMMLLR